MTPAHTEILRRSGAGMFRESSASLNVTINDDDEERRQARRRTMQSAAQNDSSTVEHSETLKKCLEIYNGNKLSRENAWSLSLIDTLSTLLDRHHKSLNNFKVAGSSLEASSKVYGLRVDSIHTDVLRMSAGLNAQKFNERDFEDDDDGVATGGDGAADPGSPAAGLSNKVTPKAKQPKRARKAVSTITKNKETLNARLDTVPLQDPVFGKLNSTVGSINSSNRLMINVLLTTDSELRLRTNFRFWEAKDPDPCDYTEEQPIVAEVTPDDKLASCERLFKIQHFEALQLRPLHSGYIISDTPEALPDDNTNDAVGRQFDFSQADYDATTPDNICGDAIAQELHNNSKELSMAFDMNAECEPLPSLNEQAPMVDVDYGDFDDLTTDERTAINNCRGLRKAPVVIEDLRPVDASSKLEYSYRPLDKISQFWAGPSHWKFKRSRARPSTLSQGGENLANRASSRGRRVPNLQAKKRSKQLNFSEVHDELFLKLDSKYKARKTNIQKKWDPRKLKLPTDLQLDQDMFFKYQFAPGLAVEPLTDDTLLAPDGDDLLDGGGGDDTICSPSGDDLSSLPAAHPFDDVGCGDMNMMQVSSDNLMTTDSSAVGDDGHFTDGDCGGGADGDGTTNDTVLEIATEFKDAPSQVTKIIVPFAKRAKVIDMKNLKLCCAQLLSKQMRRPVNADDLPVPAVQKQEQYAPGFGSFREMYQHLPELLSPAMAEALSPSIAFYSVLHLANDFNFRLVQQDDLNDFAVRQLVDEANSSATQLST